MSKLDLRNTIKKVVHSHLKEKKYYAELDANFKNNLINLQLCLNYK